MPIQVLMRPRTYEVEMLLLMMMPRSLIFKVFESERVVGVTCPC
jgi:hypothetical protein